jgi:hypothetical protein
MKLLIALLILGSIATSASAAGSDIHGLVDAQTGHTVIFRGNIKQPANQRLSLEARGSLFRTWRCGLRHW